jgi:pimeloyl-ACP methyl ester carboxylesterase
VLGSVIMTRIGGLDVELSGPAGAPVVLFHTGTPAAGRMFAPQVDAGAARGLRHLTYSRPGYGRSDRVPGRQVADCVRDVAAILDGLQIDRIYSVGLSGGGPHSLACAALLPDRVIAAATLGGVAPWNADGLDWLDGMGEDNHAEFGAAVDGEEPLRKFLEPLAAEMSSASPAELHAAFGDLVSGVDRAAISGEFAEHLSRILREGLSDGIWGWFDDDIAFVAHWGFDLASIERPVTIWHGAQDRFVPPSHGRWLVEHIPGARAQLRPEHGHLSFQLTAYGEILDDLIATGTLP